MTAPTFFQWFENQAGDEAMRLLIAVLLGMAAAFWISALLSRLETKLTAPSSCVIRFQGTTGGHDLEDE